MLPTDCKSRQKIAKVANRLQKLPTDCKSCQKIAKVANRLQKLPTKFKSCQQIAKVVIKLQKLPTNCQKKLSKVVGQIKLFIYSRTDRRPSIDGS